MNGKADNCRESNLKEAMGMIKELASACFFCLY
jgi:hypothetical protein